MKYYIDTEFIEDFHKPLLGKRRHFIDLISIAVVCEDGREYHAISREYRYKDASQWVKDNVITPLYLQTVHGSMRNQLDVRNFSRIKGKSSQRIQNDLLDFFLCEVGSDGKFYAPPGIEVYAYFADYDWVALCSLFGRMIDLPTNFPMYCRDLKQMMDAQGLTKEWKDEACPSPVNEHTALADARWNMRFHKAIIEQPFMVRR